MMKQVKLLTLVTIITAGSVLQAATVDPVSRIVNVLKRSNTMATYVAAVVLGNIAYSNAQREYDDKGNFRSVGNKATDSLTEELCYCAAVGTGLTALENSVSGDSDLTIRGSIDCSITNAVSCYLTNLIARQDAYKALNRNHVLLRGWLPEYTKFDEPAKKMFTLAVVRSLVNSARARLNIAPAA